MKEWLPMHVPAVSPRQFTGTMRGGRSCHIEPAAVSVRRASAIGGAHFGSAGLVPRATSSRASACVEFTVSAPPVIRGTSSSRVRRVCHEALWLALVNEVHRSRAHAPKFSVIECDGHVGRKFSPIGTTQHAHVREEH